MKLLSIKAHGFKSFADKIEITIGDGITGIVGPNGSGKSNVVDAVKWVLGSASLKEIRGGETMSDVIFAGSSSRSPLSRAWVSLTFDNSDHYLASDLSEIEIKREVFKTGENEYYINNAKVRKKDITDLFLDSGANADSFSIISQGKISEILKGKPSDRRVILEEASGVLKYKKRKEDTMRKLDNANDNLDKVNLVINELEDNVEPLRVQAEAARRYIHLKEELRTIDVALLANDIKRMNEEYVDSKEALESLNEEIMNMDNATSIDHSKLEHLKQKSSALDDSITKLSEEIMELNRELAQLETQKQVISERKKYEVEDAKLENNILVLKENIVGLKKNITLLESEKEEVQRQVEKLEEEERQEEEEHRLMNLKRETLMHELQSKNKDEVSLRNRIEVLNDNIDNDTKLPYAVKSVLNNPRLKGIHDVLCKVIDTEEKYVTALEIAMGANANVIIVDDENSGREAIQYLKDNKLGRATFFPISIIEARFIDEGVLKLCKEVPGFIDVASHLVTYNPLYKSIIENQLGNTLIVKDMEAMQRLGEKIRYRYRIITLDGELLHTGGAMSGGMNKASKGIMNVKFELERCHKELLVAVNEAKRIEEHINSIDNELKLIRDKVFHVKGKKANLQEQVVRKQVDLEDYKKRLCSMELELQGTENVLTNEVDRELDQVMGRLLDISTKRELANQKLNEFKIEKNDLHAEINEMEFQNKKQNSEYNRKQKELKDLEVNIGKMDIKLDTMLSRLSEDYQLTYERAKEEYELDMEEMTARSKVNQIRRDIKDLGDVNVGSIAEFERVNERYTFLNDQKVDLENAIANLLEIITDLDETMKNKFAETFEKVNEEFGSVFRKLFKGGHASLELTNPEDLLTTGIDISAEPPGKSLKNINTLSGGEMTLTAIALLFSILNIRTVPFCILDEVEAALDEANVDTFGTYIKEYEKHSQFIVITHKKRTMEYANTLYGITMQESGVSKLVSVRLENIQEN